MGTSVAARPGQVPTQTEPGEEIATQTAETAPATANVGEQTTEPAAEPVAETAAAPAADKPLSTFGALKIERDQLQAASVKQIATIAKLKEQAVADANTIEKLAAQVQKLASEMMDGHAAEEGVPPADGESSEDELDRFAGEPHCAGCLSQILSLCLSVARCWSVSASLKLQ